MSFDRITRGKIKLPYLCLIYGTDGVGKSTFAAAAPNCIFLGTERGTSNLDVARWPTPQNFSEIILALTELSTRSHEFKSLAIDSLDWIEPLVWDAVCRENGCSNIESVGGGYGKGYVYAMAKWQAMRDRLTALREKGMNIILISHAQIRTFHDPSTTASYDRYQLKLNEKAGAMWREYVDSVLFANFEVHTKSEGNRARALGDGSRVIFTERRPSFDAKNRVGLPFKIPLSWTEFDNFSNAERTAEQIESSIMELLKLSEDAELKSKVTEAVAKAKGNAGTLLVYENSLKNRIGA